MLLNGLEKKKFSEGSYSLWQYLRCGFILLLSHTFLPSPTKVAEGCMEEAWPPVCVPWDQRNLNSNCSLVWSLTNNSGTPDKLI